jgi:hypothetical protein
MQEEYEGGFAEQERRLLPRASNDVVGNFIELYKNDGLMPYQSPRNCYELYSNLESQAALAKLCLKIDTPRQSPPGFQATQRRCVC